MQTSSVPKSFRLYFGISSQEARTAQLCRQSTGEKHSGLPDLQKLLGFAFYRAEMVRSVYDECHVFSDEEGLSYSVRLTLDSQLVQ